MNQLICSKKSTVSDFNSRRGFLGIVLFLFLLIPVSADSLSSYASLKIENIPEKALFYLNGTSTLPDEYGVIMVQPGMINLEIKRDNIVMYSTRLKIDTSESSTISFNCSDECAFLHVVTEPSGAVLSMNGTILGITPYMNRFIKPGSYSIMATYPGYIPVIRRLDLIQKSDIHLYTMEPTQSLKDSLSAVKNALRKRRQRKNSTLFGITAIGMFGAGAYYDWKAYGYLVKMNNASDAYNAATNEQACEKQKLIYNKSRQDTEKPIRYRNIFYGAAGVCLAGFYVSFFF